MQIASEEIFTRIKLGLIMIGALFIRRHLSMSWKYILVPYYLSTLLALIVASLQLFSKHYLIKNMHALKMSTIHNSVHT